MVLHQGTLWAALSVSGAASAVVFAGLARYAPRIPGPAYWSAASACAALAFGSQLTALGDWRIASVIFNIPFSSGPVLLFAGLARFYGGAPHDRLVRVLVGVAIASTLAFTFAVPNTAARIAALSLVVVIGYAGAAVVAWRESSRRGRMIARVLALTFLANGIATLVRAVLILLAPVQYGYATPELAGLNNFVWVTNVIVTTVSAPLLALAVAVRLLASLDAEKRRTEASEAQFRELATSAGVGILVADGAGRCTYANPRCDEITGLPAGSLLGDGWRTALASEDSPDVAAAWRDAAREGALGIHTFRVRRPTGEVRWVRSRPVALRSDDGQPARFLATIEDITGLRNSYERIRELAQRLETVREDERRSVAHALHEGVAQDLVAATLDLNRLRTAAGDDPQVAAACADVAQAIDKCIGDLRELTNALRPGTLAHLPLVSALDQYARQFAERSGLRISIVERSVLPRINEAMRLAFFRAAQEVLTNVVRHARAVEVNIVLACADHRLEMAISDDGVGIGDHDLEKANALGLLGLQERFAALGGGLTVQRQVPRGTTITTYLPAAAD